MMNTIGSNISAYSCQSRSSVYWSREADSVAAFSFLDDGAFPLADQGGATLGGASAPAYNCTRCKKIILDYSVRHLSP